MKIHRGKDIEPYPKEPVSKLLFLDDRTKRLLAAPERYPTFEVTIVANVKECLRYMSSEDWDVISLDHDLQGCDFDDPDSPETGMAVLRYIQKTGWPPSKTKPIIWVHSSNLFATHLMCVTLDKLGFINAHKPFIYPGKRETMQYDEDGNPCE